MTWKGQLFFEEKPETEPPVLPGSLVAFSRNGALQGVAFRRARPPAPRGCLWVVWRAFVHLIICVYVPECCSSYQAWRPRAACAAVPRCQFPARRRPGLQACP